MKRITIFCGSSFGTDANYETEAFKLGQAMASNGYELVYGGANVGLMGAVADGILGKGGKAYGILPRFLMEKEIAHKGLTELHIVESMHERKTKMNEMCDGVIVLPGGFGTLEEFFEMLTWAQLGLHKKPIGILNIGGFYNLLLEFVANMAEKGFLKPINQQMILVSDKIEDLFQKIEAYKAPEVGKWINKGKE